MTNIQAHIELTDAYAARAGMSRYDFLELEAFTSKVDHEGYRYAAENYGPEFEAAELRNTADDPQALHLLYRTHRPAIDAWWEELGGEAACDLHNDHIDEARQRVKDACLWGVRCTDGYIVHEPTEEKQKAFVARIVQRKKERPDIDYRVPEALLHREVPGGEWTTETPVTT